VKLAKGPLQVGDVMQHGMAEHQVEAAVGQLQALGVTPHRGHGEPQLGGVAPQLRQHPGGDVHAHGRADHACLHEVEGEVARAGPDLQRPAERLRPAAQGLSQLGQDLVPAHGAEVDPPLGVVLGGGGVVVAGVDVADPGRGGGGRHERGEL
jgi:hypothetical protein